MHIAAFVEGADHVCCRYRIAAFGPHLAAAGHSLEIRPIPKGPWHRWRLFRSLGNFDAVILQRKLFSRWELALLRRYAKILIFDYDDAVWLRDSYAAKGLWDRRRRARFAATCRAADALTPGNAFLDSASVVPKASFIPATMTPAALVIPTCVDEALYPAEPTAKPDGRIRLVWIGSSSTLQGLRGIAEILDSLADLSPKLLLRIICDQPLPLNRLPVEFVPWSAATEIPSIAECDIGISWIPDDDWSRGKCGLKTLQYMAAGLTVIANPVGVHSEMIGDGGFLAETAEQWRDAVRKLIDDPNRRLEMGRHARRRFEEHYSLRRGGELWLGLLKDLERQPAADAGPVRVKPRSEGNRLPEPGDIRWHFALGSPLSTDSLDIKSMLADGSACVVKEGAHRTVYRLTLDGSAYYWKFCKLSGFRAWAREWLREPKAKLEFDRANVLRKQGIGTFEPVAWGTQPGFFGGQSHLITKAIPAALSLGDLIAEMAEADGAGRRRLAVDFGRFFARLNRAGIDHPDPHPGNFLVALSDETCEFFILDLHAIAVGRVHFHDGGDPRESGLHLLNRWFQLRTSRVDRLRFWKAFRPDLPRGDRDVRGEIVRIESIDSNASLWRSRFKRPIRHERHFPSVRCGELRGYRSADFPAEFAERLAVDPDGPFTDESKLWKNSKSSSVAPLEFEGRAYVWKRFKIQSFGDALKNLIRRSPTIHSWLMGHALLDRLLPTAKPVLVLHRYRCGIPCEGYLLCERLEGVRELQEALDVPFSESRAYKRELIHQLARTIRLMHERFLVHRDLKAANLLVRTEDRWVRQGSAPTHRARIELHHSGDPVDEAVQGDCGFGASAQSLDAPYEKPLIWFVDLVGMEPVRRPSPRRQLRDLVRLNASFANSPHVTRTDRLRFLRTYFLWSLRSRGNWKETWRWIAGETAAKVERNRRRGRVLK